MSESVSVKAWLFLSPQVSPAGHRFIPIGCPLIIGGVAVPPESTLARVIVIPLSVLTVQTFWSESMAAPMPCPAAR